jgi:hypothetical protein
MAMKDLIISIAITIFLLTVIGAIYTISLALKLLPIVIILFFILYVIGAFGKLTSKKMKENYQVVVNDDTNYNQTTCYMNGNRPFIMNQDGGDSFQGSTMRCAMKGGPAIWDKPNWLLPISDPKNPAYYNQFPSQALKFN